MRLSTIHVFRLHTEFPYPYIPSSYAYVFPLRVIYIHPWYQMLDLSFQNYWQNNYDNNRRHTMVVVI